MSDTQQSQVDQIVAQLHDLDDGLAAAQQRILDKISGLQTSNPGVDLSALVDEVNNSLTPHVQAIDDIAPVVATPGENVTPPDTSHPAAFVEKLADETYDQYLARANAAGVTPVDQPTWAATPVS